MKSKFPVWLLTAITLVSTMTTSAFAEEHELETVTVTAQKTEENIQKIPMSVSAFSDLQIEDAGIDNTAELTRFSPNTFMKTGGTIENIVLIRGITSYESSVYSPTAFYVDDVNLPLHFMHNVSLFDTERVEVLKGPQGTLYGRNNEAGVINIITRQPEGPFSAKVFADLGSYSNSGHTDLNMGLGLNLPIVKDSLTLGIFAQSETSKGYMKNIYNDDSEAGKIDQKNYRANLHWIPSDKWDVSLIADSLKFDNKIGYFRYLTGAMKTDRFEISHDREEWAEVNGMGQTLRVKYKGGAFDLLSITGVRNYQNKNFQDGDAYSDPYMDYGGWTSDYKNDHTSQEIRLLSPEGNSPFKWLIGLYTFQETTTIDLSIDTRIEIRNNDIDIQGNALFAQATYSVTDKLDLTAGVRVDNEEQKGKQDFNYQGWPTIFEKDLSIQETLPRVAVSYDVNDDIMVYASLSKGYMSGGYNYSLVYSQEAFAFKPEYTTNREIGVKSSWFGNSLVANLCYFDIDMTDKQVSQVGGINLAVTIENAAKANSSGLELELAAKLAEGLDLTAGFGVVDAKYKDYIASEYSADYTSTVTNDYSGNTIANVPEHTFNIGLQYRHTSGLTGRLDLLGTGSAYVDSANTTKMDAYNLVNFRFGYETETYDAFLWGKNIFDQEYQTVQWMSGNDVYGQDGEPAQFGASFAYRFQ